MPKNLTRMIGIAILLGVVLGLVANRVPALATALGPLSVIGDLFIAALKMLVVPVIATSLIVGVTSIGDVSRVGKMGSRAAAYYLSTTGLAAILGLTLVNLIQPGVGADLGAAAMTEAATRGADLTLGGFVSDFLVRSVRNPFAALAGGDVLSIILFCLLFGGALVSLGDTAKPVVDFFRVLDKAVMRMIEWVMWLAAPGVFVLLFGALSQGGVEALSSLARYCITVIAALLIHGFVILPLIVKFIGGRSPIEWLRGIRPAMAVALSTSSSSATLPVTIEACEKNLDVPRPVASFVLPLGATMNMDGTALYEAIAAMFVAQAYGIDLTLGQQFLVFFTASAASVGAAGIPSAGLVTMAMVFTAVGLPLEGIGLIVAVDRFLDMGRTVVNVMGDTVGTVVVDRYTRDGDAPTEGAAA
jgi:Na+/H+-dicarboxylate symporter